MDSTLALTLLALSGVFVLGVPFMTLNAVRHALYEDHTVGISYLAGLFAGLLFLAFIYVGYVSASNLLTRALNTGTLIP